MTDIEPSGQQKPIGQPSTEDSRRWQDEADDLRHTALQDIRASAEKWASSISALIGVFSVVAFVKGRDTFANLEPAARNASAALVIAATVCAASAVALAAFAAQGWPRTFDVLSGDVLANWYQRQLGRAVWSFRISRFLALASAIVLVSAVTLTWFGSERSTPSDGAQPSAIPQPTSSAAP